MLEPKTTFCPVGRVFGHLVAPGGLFGTDFIVIRTHLSHRLNSVVSFLGLRRNGSSSQVIDQPQDFLEQVSRHGNLGQLERDITAMANDLGSDLD